MTTTVKRRFDLVRYFLAYKELQHSLAIDIEITVMDLICQRLNWRHILNACIWSKLKEKTLEIKQKWKDFEQLKMMSFHTLNQFLMILYVDTVLNIQIFWHIESKVNFLSPAILWGRNMNININIYQKLFIASYGWTLKKSRRKI